MTKVRLIPGGRKTLLLMLAPVVSACSSTVPCSLDTNAGWHFDAQKRIVLTLHRQGEAQQLERVNLDGEDLLPAAPSATLDRIWISQPINSAACKLPRTLTLKFKDNTCEKPYTFDDKPAHLPGFWMANCGTGHSASKNRPIEHAVSDEALKAGR